MHSKRRRHRERFDSSRKRKRVFFHRKSSENGKGFAVGGEVREKGYIGEKWLGEVQLGRGRFHRET
eukprot:2140598-Rhodomonas_salina.2